MLVVPVYLLPGNHTVVLSYRSIAAKYWTYTYYFWEYILVILEIA